MPPQDWQDLSRAIADDPDQPAQDIDASPSETDNAGYSYPNEPRSDRRIRDWRRSERVRVEMLVNVCVCSDDDDEPLFWSGKTIDVSAHGALLDVSMPVEVGQTLRVVNVRTRREIECHVLRFAKRYPDGGGHIGVEFAGVSRHFWGISSQPANWDPDWAPPGQPERPIPQGVRDSTNALPRTDKLPRERVQAPAIERKVQARFRVPNKKIMVALIAPVVLLIGWMAVRSPNDGTGTKEKAAGIEPEDAGRIPRIDRMRLAAVGDFEPDAVSWLHDSEQQVSGKISGFYSSAVKSNAYVLVGKANERRVVIFAGGQLRYNAEYPTIAIAACVPMELVHQIKWAEAATPTSDGDGLLIVRAADAPASGVILFLRGSQVVSASPVDYREVKFGQGCQP